MMPSAAGLNRYGARNTTKPVNFYCSAPTAAFVVLVGDFNNWDLTLRILCDDRLMGLGSSRCNLLTAITSIYSSWTVNQSLDPRGTGIARNDLNERVSLIAVS